MIASQSSKADDPGNGAFDDPALASQARGRRKHLLPLLEDLADRETLQRRWLGWTDHFDGPAEVLAQPTDECAAVVAIAPHMAQAGKETVQGSQHLLGAFQVGAIGCQDFHSQ